MDKQLVEILFEKVANQKKIKLPNSINKATGNNKGRTFTTKSYQQINDKTPDKKQQSVGYNGVTKKASKQIEFNKNLGTTVATLGGSLAGRTLAQDAGYDQVGRILGSVGGGLAGHLGGKAAMEQYGQKAELKRALKQQRKGGRR